MLRLVTFFVTLIGLLITSDGFAQVRLERKYQEGSTYRSESTTQTEQKLTIAGMEQETASDTQVVTKAIVGKRDAGGNLRIEEKIELLQVKTTVLGMQYNFDSKNPDVKGTSVLEKYRDVHKALSQRSSFSVIDKDNKIQSIEIDANFLNGLDPEIQKEVKSQVDPQQLKQVANQENNRLPSEAVNKGDTWIRTETVDFGSGQQMTFQTEYTYQGTAEKNGKTLDKITSKVLTVSYALSENSPLPIKLKGSDLKATETAGELFFDRAIGRTLESTQKMRITGDLQFSAGTVELPAKLDLKVSSSAKLLADTK